MLSSLFAPSSVQQQFARLRFLGYAGAQFNALLVPLLVFKLTGSAKLVGIALLIEWVPKLVLYLSGGLFLQRFGSSKMHSLLEVARLTALGVLLLSAAGLGSIWILALAAAVYQSSNALSNILFERAVTQWWAPPERTAGHALLLQKDQWGGGLALVLGLALSSPLVLAAVAMALQAFTVYSIRRFRNTMYPEAPPVAGAMSVGKSVSQLGSALNSVARKEIVLFALMAMLISIPIAFVFSGVALFLEQSMPGSTEQTGWLSLLLLARTGLSIAALRGTAPYLTYSGGKTLALVGLSILLGAVLLLSVGLPLWALIATMAVLGASGCLYTPWMRSERQKLISRLIPEHLRASVTGMLLAIDAGAYLIAGGLMTVYGNKLGLATLLTAGALTAGIAFVVVHMLRDSPEAVALPNEKTPQAKA